MGETCSKDNSIEKIITVIDSDSSTKVIDFAYSLKRKNNLRENTIKLKNLDLNALSYSLLSNKIKSFAALREIGISTEIMYENFRFQNFDPMLFLCARNQKKSLKLYLELYIQADSNFPKLKNEPETYIQTAVRHGMIENLRTIKRFFNKVRPNQMIKDFDFKSTGVFGENCVLYACRYGQLALLELFYSEFDLKAEFSLLNHNQLGAIELCIAGYYKLRNERYKSCLRFLLTTVRLSPRFSFRSFKLLTDKIEILIFLDEIMRLNQFGFCENELNCDENDELVKWVEYNESNQKFLEVAQPSIYSNPSTFDVLKPNPEPSQTNKIIII